MAEYTEDMQVLKDSVQRVIDAEGSKNRVRKKFKLAVVRAIKNKSNLTGKPLKVQIRAALDLVDEFWKEICNKDKEPKWLN